MNFERGNIHNFPKSGVPSANDNEADASRERPKFVIDGFIEGELQAVFNEHREQNPNAWKEIKLNQYRDRLSIVHPEVLTKQVNESTPADRLVDPRYFYIALELIEKARQKQREIED